MSQAVPFAGFLGLEFIEIEEGRAVVRLAERPELGNHVGSQHAGALFTAGRTPCGSQVILIDFRYGTCFLSAYV
jgi:acyl-coenzyme A thioesterase PaaI-like protein